MSKKPISGQVIVKVKAGGQTFDGVIAQGGQTAVSHVVDLPGAYTGKVSDKANGEVTLDVDGCLGDDQDVSLVFVMWGGGDERLYYTKAGLRECRSKTLVVDCEPACELPDDGTEVLVAPVVEIATGFRGDDLALLAVDCAAGGVVTFAGDGVDAAMHICEPYIYSRDGVNGNPLGGLRVDRILAVSTSTEPQVLRVVGVAA